MERILGGFTIKEVKNGLLYDERDSMYPSAMFGFIGGKEKYGENYATSYGIVKNGKIILKTNGKEYILNDGEYFSVLGVFELEGVGECTITTRYGFNGVFNIGGPIEKKGRLSYIDGCHDSMLIYPPRLGDPVYNVLWFPKNIDQTMHIHPSIRFGYVVYGNGVCITPEGELPLEEGKVFCLKEMSQHCFNTGDSEMAIVAYHPDSDWGPSDTNHPMLNRTLIK